ncbi:MAG: glutathione S-transferase family protein [Proteobacteria bacterium]|nr:glutathione S-transferase family protein [Pseudomonadota bacterium]
MPATRHGDVQLYETSAIVRYIDEVFDGPSLLPATATERAVMEQWVSVLNCYVYDHLIRNYALQYIIPSLHNQPPNRDAINAGLDHVGRDLELIDAAYAGRDWIASKSLSLADLFLGPVLATVTRFPEAAAAVEGKEGIKAFINRIERRDNYRAFCLV